MNHEKLSILINNINCFCLQYGNSRTLLLFKHISVQNFSKKNMKRNIILRAIMVLLTTIGTIFRFDSKSIEMISLTTIRTIANRLKYITMHACIVLISLCKYKKSMHINFISFPLKKTLRKYFQTAIKKLKYLFYLHAYRTSNVIIYNYFHYQ